MSELLNRLPSNRRRGSKPRCHWIMHGTREMVAARLSGLIAPHGQVAATDQWMPDGFTQTDEGELHRTTRLLPAEHSTAIGQWWFAVQRGGRQKSPNFDIASTCTVTGADGRRQPGLLLVEAKAHDEELIAEEGGKRLGARPSAGERVNHERIGQVISQTNPSFVRDTGLPWSVSRDVRYQMSNRFAVACKLTELGHAVVLVYLGFRNAKEMADQGRPFDTPAQWQALVKSHSAPLFPDHVWDKKWQVHGQPFIPLIRSTQIRYDSPIADNCEVS